MTVQRKLTKRGKATRSRIVESAADLVLSGGVGGTSLDDIGSKTSTSKSQLFHYFPGGKSELVGAIAALQSQRVIEAQEPYLARLARWEDWLGWRDAVLAHYGEQSSLACPIGALASELTSSDPARAAQVSAYMEDWRRRLRDGLERMADNGELREEVDPDHLSRSLFASLQGGLLLMQTGDSIIPLEAGLDGILEILRGQMLVPPPR